MAAFELGPVGSAGDFWVDNPMEESSAEERACAQGTELGRNVGDLGTCIGSVWKSIKLGPWE